jgi:hypothetical protein
MHLSTVLIFMSSTPLMMLASSRVRPSSSPDAPATFSPRSSASSVRSRRVAEPLICESRTCRLTSSASSIDTHRHHTHNTHTR